MCFDGYMSHGLNAAGTAAGVSFNGQMAEIIGIVATIAIGFRFSKQMQQIATA
jgi:hypothetical protein